MREVAKVARITPDTRAESCAGQSGVILLRLVNLPADAGWQLGLAWPGHIASISVLEQLAPAGWRTGLRTIDDVYDDPERAMDKLRRLAERIPPEAGPASEAHRVLGPPVPPTARIICVGLNYRQHTAEIQMDVPPYPVLFSKYPNALAGHRQPVTRPDVTAELDYEAELVVVMGRHCYQVGEEQALSYVLGYCNGNDLSARDLQFRTGQWLIGKTLDGFAPVGPYLVTADEVGDPGKLAIECRVNGEIRQTGTTADMLFSVPFLISYLSRLWPLRPGDMIFTGTPPGVAMGMPKGRQKWLTPGDQVTVAIEGLGELVTPIV